MVRELHRKSLFFKFANHYVNEHKTDSLLTVTPEVLAEFKKYLDKEKFDFQEESEKRVKELETIADKSHYGKDVSAERVGRHGFERRREGLRQIRVARRLQADNRRKAEFF